MIKRFSLKRAACFLLSLVIFMGTFITANAAEYEPVVKTPLQDTYVDGSEMGNGFYFYAHLQVGYGMWSYISFDMTDIQYINYKAVLRLVPRGNTNGVATMAVYGVNNQDWEQSTINGVNRPLPTERLGQFKTEVDTAVEIDVTRYVRSCTNKRGKISFVVLEDNGAGKASTLYSKESGNGPTLTIDRNAYDAKLYEGEPEEEPVYYQVKSAAAEEVEEEDVEPEPFNREEFEYEVAPPDLSLIPDGTDIDEYTTTRTAPWMVNYHLTRAEQVAAGYYGGECGQLAYTMDISPSNSDKMIVGLDTCGLFKSEDGGKTWRDTTNNYAMMGAIDVRFDPDDENIIYVAACPHKIGDSGSYYKYSGLWKSENGGKTWRQLNNFQYTARYHNGYVIQFSEKNKDGKRRIYTAGYNETVNYSDDDGETWTAVEGLESKGIRRLTVIGDEVIASTMDGIYSSVNCGEWVDCSEGLEKRTILGYAVDPKDSTHRFCVDGSNLYESVDSGKSWKVINTKEKLGVTGGIASVLFNVPKGDEPVIMYLALTSNVWTPRCSLDYGRTFSNPIFHGETAYLPRATGWFSEAFSVDPNSSTEIMVSMDGEMCHGVFEDDGKLHIYPSASGISGVRASDFAFTPDNPNEMYIAAIDRGVAKLYDTGNGENYPLSYNEPFEDVYNIREFGQKTTTAIGIDPRDSNRLIVSVGSWNKCKLKESVNGGLSYVTLPAPEIGSVTCIEFNKNNPDIIYAGSIISYDNGVSWKKSKIAVKEVSPINPDTVYGISGENVYVSYDCGRNWEKFSNQAVSGPQRICADVAEYDKVYIGTFTNGLYILTKDTAKHIGTKNGLVPSAAGALGINDIAQNPNNPKHLLAGGCDNYNMTVSGGLFESLDGGDTWHVVDGVGNTKDIWVIEFHPLKPAAYIGTSSGTYVYEYENWFDRSENCFNDVEYASDEFNRLVSEGVISGYEDGSFKPDKVLTRAEFAEFIKNVLPKSKKNPVKFADVDDKTEYHASIDAVAAAGVMVGNNGLFRPNDAITQEEVMTVLAKLIDFGKISKQITLEEAREAKINQGVSDYAKYSVYKCFCNGIISDNDEKFEFSPQKELTRMEAATLIYRIKEATGW